MQVAQEVPSAQVAQVDMQAVQTPLAPYCPAGHCSQKEGLVGLHLGHPPKQAVQFTVFIS